MAISVDVVVQYLADVAKEEAALLGGVRREVVEFEESLRSIEAFLEDAESMEDNGQGVKEWVRQVRDVAYDIENVVDEFLLRIGPKQPHQQGLSDYFRRIAHFTRQLRARHQIGTRIEGIKNRLHRIEERKNMFASAPVPSKVTRSRDSYDTLRLSKPQFIEDSNIVGIEKPKQELMKKLLEEDSNLAVISVFGMGGLGKTTLVRKVYDSKTVQKKFNCFAWITVSQSVSPIVLLRRIFNSFMSLKKQNFIGFGEYHSREEIENMEHVQLVAGLKAYMQKKRYLVILDDVWTTSAWEHLSYVFPENALKSRIVITTRRHDIALFCSGSKIQNVHKMEPLPEKEAWTLFCKKGFGGSCPPVLENQSKIILKICGGLPLAIVTMSGLLSSPNKWNRVLMNLTLTLEKNETVDFMNHVLWLSYDDLPHHLKCCLLYFGSYPEDFEVDGRALVRQWISEGFVKATNKEFHEDLAEAYLHELVDRSLVEVVDYAYDGSILFCRVHDLMHRLILEKLKEENFFTTSAMEDVQPNQEVRRLSINSGENAPRGKNLSRLRTLCMFDASDIPKLSSFPMLRVLNLSGSQIQVFPSEIAKLYHLTYLNLRNTQINKIPKSIKNLRKLQTLDLTLTNVTELPDAILHLHAICHLQIWPIKSSNGVRMPTRLGQLKHLHEIENLGINGDTEQARELGKLTELRRLCITAVKRQDWDAICDSITNMRHLTQLHISTHEEEPVNIDFMSSLSPTLLTISFAGRLKMLPKLTGRFFSLVNLSLIFSRLSEDPLKALQHLPMLQNLTLCDAFNGEEMSCGGDGYQSLQKFLIIDFSRLRFVHIANGAMLKLTVMEIKGCCRLEGVPLGVENLQAMMKLHFINMPRGFIQKVWGDEGERAKVEHIPLVKHFIEDDSGTRSEVEYLF